MGDITREDLKTILKFGIHLARLDSNFHIEEKRVLRRFSEAIGLTDAEREALMAGDSSLGHGLVDLSSDAAKELLLKTLCIISFVDGHTGPDEVGFIERVIEKMNSTSFLLPKEEWGGYEKEVFDTISKLV